MYIERKYYPKKIECEIAYAKSKNVQRKRKKDREAAVLEINGKFDVKHFYETLARIMSQKENMAITVTVHEDVEENAAGTELATEVQQAI